MKIVAKRYVDEFAPGAEIAAGRYDEGALGALLDKGHFVIVEDAEPGTAADSEPEQAAAQQRRERALAEFARKAGDEVTVKAAGLPQPVIVERIPEAESDTVTRVYTPVPPAEEKPAPKTAAKTEKPAKE